MTDILNLIYNPIIQTIYMVLTSSFFGIIIGLPLGIILYITNTNGLSPIYVVNKILGTLVNVLRSFPFIVLLIFILPLSRIIIGTSIGTTASILPLSIAAAPFIARLVENSLLEIDNGIIEAAIAMGSTNIQIISKVLLPEALPSLVNGFTLTIINLIGCSAMAGAVGAGGLGDLAIRYGYYRFETKIMLISIVLIIILVQLVQFIGNSISNNLLKNR